MINYLSEQAWTQLKQVAEKYRLPGRDGIIRPGVQIATNDEVFALLARMCMPKNTQAMQYELHQSCFPTKVDRTFQRWRGHDQEHH